MVLTRPKKLYMRPRNGAAHPMYAERKAVSDNLTKIHAIQLPTEDTLTLFRFCMEAPSGQASSNILTTSAGA